MKDPAPGNPLYGSEGVIMIISLFAFDKSCGPARQRLEVSQQFSLLRSSGSSYIYLSSKSHKFPYQRSCLIGSSSLEMSY